MRLFRFSGIFRSEGQFVSGEGGIDVTGGDQFLQPEEVEVQGEILEEVALVGVVAVAENGLTAEVGDVVTQFGFDVGELGVEYVFLGDVGVEQSGVVRHAWSPC